MPDLSVLIPARNEIYLANTIADILQHSEADTEIIAVLDGAWADPGIPDDPRVTLVYHPQSVGQRAACNEAARLARAPWVMKCDAHCAFGQGFDIKLLADAEPDMTLVPIMANLHVFNRVCQDCGHTRYQGPTQPCPKCGGTEKRVLVWKPKDRTPHSSAYCFDPEPHFQYDGQMKKRMAHQRPLSETMSLQGSCWMLTKERYHALNVCDESWGSWGSQGIEVACKTWLSGGRVLCDHNTWYAHAFRTQGGDWGFPYQMSRGQQEYAKKCAWDTFFVHGWEQEIHPLSWLLERFWPVRGWTDEDLEAQREREADRLKPVTQSIPKPITKGILYYTDNRLDPLIMNACRRQLLKARLPIVSVSLKPIDYGLNIVLDAKRGPLTMHRQILAGLEAIRADVVFFCEHDILYDPSHFEFTPEREDRFYYNTNVWRVRYVDGHAVWTDDLQQTSGLCARRDLLLTFYRQRVAKIERDGFDRHYEPGPKVGPYRTENWRSSVPLLDIRHDQTLTHSKWSPSEYRNKRYARGWRERSAVPGWGLTAGRMPTLLEGITNG